MREMPPGIPDVAFVRGSAPMTKAEVRAVALAKLRPFPGARVLDVGAGTGSVSVEAALLGCHVTAIERDAAAIATLAANLERFGARGVRVVDREAPEAFGELETFDRVFLGGSGGRLAEIIAAVPEVLVEGGRIVANTVGVGSTATVMRLLGAPPWRAAETVSVAIARAEPIGRDARFVPASPVWITSAVLGKDGESEA